MNIPEIWPQFGEQLYCAMEYDGYKDFETAIPYTLGFFDEDEKNQFFNYLDFVVKKGCSEEELAKIWEQFNYDYFILISEDVPNAMQKLFNNILRITNSSLKNT